MASVIPDAQLSEILERMDRAGFGAYRRLVRLGAAKGFSHFTVQIPGGTVIVRPPTGEREGPKGSVVVDITEGENRTILRPGAPGRTPGAPDPNSDRRSVRIDDDTWAWIETQGRPSAVIKDAIALLRSQRGG